ncbi:hypothetical protein KR044_009994 [Drosophila immigrans]|nr:hypothetical protein KR044_009994 [Drosophila immigrans]
MNRVVSERDIEPFLNGKPIGTGTFNVYKGTLEDDVDVAIREINVDEKNREITRREIEIMKKINHPNIVEFVTEVWSEIKSSKLYLIMEYMDGSSLHNLIHNSRNIQYTADQGIKWMTQAAEALDYLHNLTSPVIHRDVKPSNMLLDEDKEILKLCDFSLGRECSTIMTKKSGTYRYMAPEVYLGKKYTEKCDVYSLGITIWEVFSRKEPFELLTNPMTILDKVTKDKLRPLLEDIPECPKYIKKLMERCWSPEPGDRPTMKAVVEILQRTP